MEIEGFERFSTVEILPVSCIEVNQFRCDVLSLVLILFVLRTFQSNLFSACRGGDWCAEFSLNSEDIREVSGSLQTCIFLYPGRVTNCGRAKMARSHLQDCVSLQSVWHFR